MALSYYVVRCEYDQLANSTGQPQSEKQNAVIPMLWQRVGVVSAVVAINVNCMIVVSFKILQVTSTRYTYHRFVAL